MNSICQALAASCSLRRAILARCSASRRITAKVSALVLTMAALDMVINSRQLSGADPQP